MTSSNLTPAQSPTTAQARVVPEPANHGFFLAPLLQAGFNVLDATGGSAVSACEMAEVVFPGRVIMMNANPALLERRRRLIEGLQVRNVDFVAGCDQWPFSESTFDLVVAHAMPTGEATLRLLREAQRVTRPGGFISLCRPTNAPLDGTPVTRRLRRALTAYRAFATAADSSQTEDTWGEDLNAYGFVPLSTGTWDEDLADSAAVTEQIALRLDHSGQYHHARALREWAREPDASLRQEWAYITGIRADEFRRPYYRSE